MKIYSDFNLRDYNTFGLDVKADWFMEYESVEDIQEIAKSLSRPFVIVGRGSNMLFTENFRGTVLHCGITGIELCGTDVVVGAGVIWDDFVEWAVENGFSGIENLSLIPGEVGAAAVQNIGAYGAEAKDVIKWVEYVRLDNGEVVRAYADQLAYGYRQSIFKNELKDKVAVAKVCFSLNSDFVPSISYGGLKNWLQDTYGVDYENAITAMSVRKAVVDIRRSKLPDPKVLGNAGSFFMNPIVDRDVFLNIQKDYHLMPYYEQGGGVKIPAGWLIEQCGWKGRALGRAGVYEKQALVLVNLGGATGKDIVALSDMVRHDVKAKFGIDIYPEVRIL